MSKSRLYSLFSAVVLSVATVLPASATTTTLTAGPSTAEAVTSDTFDSGFLPSNYVASGPNVGVVSTGVVNQVAVPTGDSTPFAYAGPQSSITATFSGGVNYFGFYWGSPDNWNTLTFVDTNGVSTVYGEGGLTIAGLVADHQTGVYVNFYDSGAAWKSVTWTSSSPAFEFDNVAAGNVYATPEPASLSLMAGGILALGAGALRRRKK